MADFNKVALLTFKDGRFLMCRKDHFTSRLILPGGRIEPGESEIQCLARELAEELDAALPSDLRYVGRYLGVAHADDPAVVKTLEIRLYSGTLAAPPKPRSEIVELVWFGAGDDRDDLTPILRDVILPDLTARRIVAW